MRLRAAGSSRLNLQACATDAASNAANAVSNAGRHPPASTAQMLRALQPQRAPSAAVGPLQSLASLPAADWLLNHPNIDILEQQLLSPLIQAGEQEEEAGQQGQQSLARPLRVGLVTLGE